MKIRIQPYKHWSGGAKALGRRCGILRATKKQVEKHGDFDYILNWGSSERKFNGTYINDPDKVAVAANKLDTAAILGNFGIPQPDYTTDRSIAQVWWDAGHAVVCRTLLRSHGGSGIVIASRDGDQPIVRAPLYTKYVKKADEYRVHVFGDRILDVQLKRKRREVPNELVDYQIRNAANGWVFTRGDIDPPECVTAAAVRAVSALDLDFGAADVGYNRKSDSAAVYEVNTAPGVEGTTLDKYFEALQVTFPQLRRGMYRRRRQIL